jgi:enoyl-CoA hydratase/carnithine racemase
MINAEEASRCGFLESLTTPGELDERIDRWLDSILNSGPLALKLQKRLIQDWEGLPLRDAIQRGIGVFGAAYRTDEPSRFTQQFFDRKAQGQKTQGK